MRKNAKTLYCHALQHYISSPLSDYLQESPTCSVLLYLTSQQCHSLLRDMTLYRVSSSQSDYKDSEATLTQSQLSDHYESWLGNHSSSSLSSLILSRNSLVHLCSESLNLDSTSALTCLNCSSYRMSIIS